MKVLFLLLVTGLTSLSGSGRWSRIPEDNGVWEEELAGMGDRGGVSEVEFFDSSAGPEKLSIGIVEEEEEEESGKGTVSSLVDEETIRRAEKVADKDLLNGLNRILKNNQTLQDVLQTEDVQQFALRGFS